MRLLDAMITPDTGRGRMRRSYDLYEKDADGGELVLRTVTHAASRFDEHRGSPHYLNLPGTGR